MSAIYMTNTNTVSVPAGSVIPVNINKRTGQAFTYLPNAAMINKPDYYYIHVNVTCSAAEAGDVVLDVQKNGENIPSLTATETIEVATTTIRTISFQGIIRVLCHEPSAPIITLVNNSEMAITVTNVSFSIID